MRTLSLVAQNLFHIGFEATRTACDHTTATTGFLKNRAKAAFPGYFLHTLRSNPTRVERVKPLHPVSKRSVKPLMERIPRPTIRTRKGYERVKPLDRTPS